jgi:Aerotolerance regulator N-terminal/von Willebrand factor type A domain/CARDB
LRRERSCHDVGNIFQARQLPVAGTAREETHMNFLNPALAFGAAAFAVPLIIHILNRSRFRTVEWGAMHLLESVIKVNHRRFHLEQLLLLLLRCALPVLLALCLARPVLTGSRVLEGAAPVSMVILLDNSYSMETVGQTGSRFDLAIEAACDILEATHRGSEISVIQTGGRPTPLFDQPVFDAGTVIQQLQQLRAGFGASDMRTAIDEGLAALSGMSHVRRELVVISDFQSADWSPINANVAHAIRQQVEAMPFDTAITLLQIGAPVTGNVSVESLDYPQKALGVGQQVALRTTIRNHGNGAAQNARVVLKIDGSEHSVQQIHLEPNGSTQSLFPCEFPSPGSHVMQVDVIVDDPLAADNHMAATISIWDNIPVLLVDGDPSSQPLKSETDFLSVALTPFTLGRVRLADLVQTNTITANELTQETLATQRVVVLANVSRLSDAALASVVTFVSQGGVLIVFPGNHIDVDWYRQHMYAGGTALLPFAFGTPRGTADDSEASARIVAQRFDHPALELFNDASNGDLTSAEIRQWYQLVDAPVEASLEPSDSNGRPAVDTENTVIMSQLDNGDVLLAERRLGDGVVVQMATACDADWSDLPMRPFFVPLVQQLITTTASQAVPPRNISTGEPAVALFPPAEGDAAVSVIQPDGVGSTLASTEHGNMLVARFDNTQRPGVYSMALPSTETIHFVANTSRAESDLNTMDESQLNTLSTAIAAAVVKSPAQFLEQDRLRRHGREIWKVVLAVLLALMFLELVLQQRFARVRA